jgi:hypothetical protein
MKCSTLLTPLMLCVIACGSNKGSPAAARVIEASESEITDCVVLRRVSGSASANDSNAELHAKQAAKAEAAKLGATHVRWIVPCCTYVEGEAYRCDAPE